MRFNRVARCLGSALAKRGLLLGVGDIEDRKIAEIALIDLGIGAIGLQTLCRGVQVGDDLTVIALAGGQPDIAAAGFFPDRQVIRVKTQFLESVLRTARADDATGLGYLPHQRPHDSGL